MSSESTQPHGLTVPRAECHVALPPSLLARISECVPCTVATDTASLLDRIVTESELRRDIQELPIDDKDRLGAQLATVVERCVDYAALAVLLFAYPRPYVYVRLRERIGLEGMRALRNALAIETSRPEIAFAWPETERPRFDMLLAPESRFDPSWAGATPSVVAAHPLAVGGEIYGALCVIPLNQDALKEREAWSLSVTVSELARVARTLSFRDEAQRLAVTDSLTGLYNCGHFMHILEDHFKVFKRYGNPFSLVLVDIDRFQQVNEQHGREVGDAVLVGVARLLQKSLREVDLVARYGSDEFILLLPQTHLEPARGVCERIRCSMEKRDLVETPVPLRVRASFGLSEASEECLGSFDLVEATDRALYASKQAGRNCVRSCGPAL